MKLFRLPLPSAEARQACGMPGGAVWHRTASPRMVSGRIVPTRLPLARLAVLVLSLLLAGPVAAFQFGVVAPPPGVGKEEVSVAQMRDAGANTLRAGVPWGNVEPEPGRFVVSAQLASVDKLVDAARAAGLRPLILLCYGSRFATADSLYDGSEESRKAFARYADWVVRHFGDRVDQYEVWNEWNAGMGSQRQPRPKGDPAAYVELLKVAHAAIKAANPKATVVAGSVAGVDLPWVDGFLKAGGAQYMGAFSVHPYMLFSPRPTPERALEVLDQMHERIAAAVPDRDIPVYVTEIGWPTNTGRFGVSEDVAADYLARFALLARTRPWIGGIWWYSLVDLGDNAEDKEHRFGLLHRDGSPKPAREQFAALAEFMKRGQGFRAETLADSTYAVTGKLGGSDWLMAWKDPGPGAPKAAGSAAPAADAGKASAQGAPATSSDAPGRARAQAAMGESDARPTGQSRAAKAAPAADLAAVPTLLGGADDTRRPLVWKRSGDGWAPADRPR
ncbi:family 1 glycosylhydrolase [Derxia gummosa]|uniref:Family 1 glycosylhydrolase n=1 Tax=Derxia gummosa DSM 723 TaxID=1121388 RepID=A0A8B6XCZ7_9BURK|nr:family 1 glycosylhydrolase [Derxia gummosa]